MEPTSSNYHDGEEEIDETYKELREKYLEKFEVPKLRLWARMISSGLHESTEVPPNIPAFHDRGSAPKKSKQDFSSALNGAAVAFAQAIGNGNGNKSTSPPPSAKLPNERECGFTVAGF